MLKIERVNTTETIKIDELFQQLNFLENSIPTDESGDSFIKNDFDIKILSQDDKFEQIEAFRWTKPEEQVIVNFYYKNQRHQLICSPKHLLYKRGSNYNVRQFEWIFAQDLKQGDKILGYKNTYFIVESIEKYNKIERLCDFQVANTHTYVVNKLLSHNSHFLVQLGAAALKRGINVVHYTLELSEYLVGKRYDSHLCELDFNDILENKEKILESYEKQKDELGRLIIKYYPTNTASVFTIRSHLERCACRGFKPGLIIMDYADVMRSSRQFDSLRHELKLIYEELRGFAGDLKLPLWTGSQSNKEGSNSDVVDLTNMSEAYGKAMVADVVVTLSRKSSEKANGTGRIFMAKNRAGKDGIVWPIRIDTAQSRFKILGVANSFDEEQKTSEVELKKSIRAKLREVETEMGDRIKK